MQANQTFYYFFTAFSCLDFYSQQQLRMTGRNQTLRFAKEAARKNMAASQGATDCTDKGFCMQKALFDLR
jgi:hypothetical protein